MAITILRDFAMAGQHLNAHNAENQFVTATFVEAGVMFAEIYFVQVVGKIKFMTSMNVACALYQLGMYIFMKSCW